MNKKMAWIAAIIFILPGISACESDEEKIERLQVDKAWKCLLAKSDSATTEQLAACDAATRRVNKFLNGM